MTGKQLTVHNASVTTMTVEVKALTIGARQVTQGIFKQLIEEPLIAEDGALNGVPWGHVAWHPDKCDGSRGHWHIVWQRGSELRRARVAEVPDFDANLRTGGIQARFWCLEADLSLASTVREWLHGRHDKSPLTPKPGYTAVYQDTYSSYQDTYSSPTEHGFSVYAIPSDQAVAAIKAKLAVAEATKFHEAASAHGGDLTYAETRVSNADVALAEAIRQLEAEIGQASYEETTEALNAATQAEAERRQRHRDIHAALAELPQLFIGG